MKKSKGIAAIAIVYFLVAFILCFSFGADISGQSKAEESKTDTEQSAQNVTNDRTEFPIIENVYEYGTGNDLFVKSDEVILHDDDKISILNRYKLPKLERMSEEDSELKLSDLQVLEKKEALNLEQDIWLYPEYGLKKTYNSSISDLADKFPYEDKTYFNGTKASELNVFMNENLNKTVEIVSEEVELDESVQIPSNVFLDGKNVVLTENNDIEYAFIADGIHDSAIRNVVVKGCQNAIYVSNSKNILIHGNDIGGAGKNGVVLCDEAKNIHIINNNIHDHQENGILSDGDIQGCIIQGNNIFSNSKGISMNADKDSALNPNHNIIRKNQICDNKSIGIYISEGYLNYILDNKILQNQQDGICLEHNTLGTYISQNTIKQNGINKFAGIAMDNVAYNTITQNIIEANFGSGIKFVRSGYRNIILSNMIFDNNVGEDDTFHAFGIELGYAPLLTDHNEKIDVTPEYENIIARNMITGRHYSGVYLAQDSYCNDLIDNIIMDCEEQTIENYSEYFNSMVGNVCN